MAKAAVTQEQQLAEYLKELEEAGGERAPKSKRLTISRCVEGFLSLVMTAPEGIEKKAQYKQRECEAEIRGFNKAQEKLREIIALNATDVQAPVGLTREEGQRRPHNMHGIRMWVG